jgi:hypothetical protein
VSCCPRQPRQVNGSRAFATVSGAAAGPFVFLNHGQLWPLRYQRRARTAVALSIRSAISTASGVAWQHECEVFVREGLGLRTIPRGSANPQCVIIRRYSLGLQSKGRLTDLCLITQLGIRQMLIAKD